MTDELKAIEARANAATPVVLDEEEYRIAYLNGGLGALVNEACCRYVGPNHGEYVSRVVNDAVGIAVRTDVPALIAKLRAAREALRFYASLSFEATHACDVDVRFQIDGGDIARKALGESCPE